jgi:hypothetical protein
MMEQGAAKHRLFHERSKDADQCVQSSTCQIISLENMDERMF